MGSIPLPALQVRTPEQPDVLNSVAKLYQLQNLKREQELAPLRQQAMQQQVQQGQIDLQNSQRDQRDQQALTKSLQDWDGSSYDSLSQAAAKNGASGKAVMGIRETGFKHQAEIANILKTQGEAGKLQLDNRTKRNDMIAGEIGAIESLPDDQIAGALTQRAQAMVQSGELPSEQAQQAVQLAASGDPQRIRQGLTVIKKGYQSDSAQIESALKAAQTQQAVSRGRLADVNAALAPSKIAAEQANNDALRKQGQQRLGLEAERLNFEKQKSGMDGNGSPNSLSRAIATGHITPDRMGYLLSKNPGLLEGVLQVDPSFDSSKAQSYSSVYKDFTSGKTSVAINAGATALGHLRELSEMNTVQSHIPGTPDYNAYQNKADTVASELAKFYGDATIPAIAAIKKTLTATLPGNRQAAIRTQAQSMGDKLDSFEQQWLNAAPSKVYQAPMPGISDKAKNSRATLAGSAPAASESAQSGVTVTAPNGKTYTFKDQAAANAFKQRAGIQ